MTTETTTKRVLLKIPGDLFADIENYRRRPSDEAIPDRQATILRLIRRGLEAEGHQRERPAE